MRGADRNYFVVGYNDSSALLLTSVMGTSVSFSGVSVSHDGGASFKASPFLDAGHERIIFLPESRWSHVPAKIFITLPCLTSWATRSRNRRQFDRLVTGVGVNRSHDGGDGWKCSRSRRDQKWQQPHCGQRVVGNDPNSPNNLYIGYTDFDFSFKKATVVTGEYGWQSSRLRRRTADYCGAGRSFVGQLCKPGTRTGAASGSGSGGKLRRGFP